MLYAFKEIGKIVNLCLNELGWRNLSVILKAEVLVQKKGQQQQNTKQ